MTPSYSRQERHQYALIFLCRIALMIVCMPSIVDSTTLTPTPTASFSVHTISVHLDSSVADDKFKYEHPTRASASSHPVEVGYLLVDFGSPIRIQRTKNIDDESDSGDPLKVLDFYPDTVDTWLGVAKLSCPSVNLSFSANTKVTDDVRSLSQGVLYTLAESKRDDSLGLILTSLTRGSYVRDSMNDTWTLEDSHLYEALYFFDPGHILQPTIEDTNHIDIFEYPNPSQLMEYVRSNLCHVEFLNDTEQRLQGDGTIDPGHIMIKLNAGEEVEGADKQEIPFIGSVPVLPWEHAHNTHNLLWPRKSITMMDDGPWTMSQLKVALDNLAVRMKQRFSPTVDLSERETRSGGGDIHNIVEATDLNVTATCLPLPPGIEQYANDMQASDIAFIQTGSSMGARVKSIAQELPKLIKQPVSDVLKPVMKLMGSFLGETLVEPLKEQMGQMTSAGMVDQIDEGLTGALIKSLSKGIPATTLETIPYVVSEGLAESLMLYVTQEVTNQITDPLADRLAAVLVKKVPVDVDSDGTAKLAERVSHATIHSLTRSISHSVVPALVHTLTHSPLQDFYCYYCFHHKTYCQYCHYAPSQLYYSLYYAGYYSTYYGEYYS